MSNKTSDDAKRAQRQKDQEYLLGLAEKIEAEDQADRLFKACMHVGIQGALIGLDDTLNADKRVAAMAVLSRAARELSAVGGFPLPPPVTTASSST